MGHVDDTEPMRNEFAWTLYERYLKEALQYVRQFELTKLRIAQLDAEIEADATARASRMKVKTAAALIDSDKNASPRRKRYVDKCQFAMQQANMYSGLATAIAAGHLQGGS